MQSSAGVGSARVLVGRERELRLLGALARSVQSGGGAAVVRGAPGVGKSALLSRLAAESSARTLWVCGTEAESMLTFAAVGDLLLPLQAHFERLPPVQRQALEVSLALSTGDQPGPLAVCAATLAVLTSAGEETPLLILVDDLQWIDPSSQQVLLFVARRLSVERVVMLLATRDRPWTARSSGLPTLELQPMSRGDCRALVAAQDVRISGEMVDRIVEHAAGNPLAALEALAATPPEVLNGEHRATGSLRLGPELHHAWAGVVDALPEPTRTALFAVAVSPSSAVAEVERALTALGGSLADLGPAEREGLVLVRQRGLSLSHPELGSVIQDLTPMATRLSVHRALADSSDGEARVWHTAASATGPDAQAARGLTDAAEAARARGAHRTAARIWRRAAELTADPGARADRLLAAATDALVAGQAVTACASCDEALAVRSDPVFAADVELVRGRAIIWLGHPGRAVDELVRAADAVLVDDPARAGRLYAEAVLPAALANRIDQMVDIARRSEQLLAGPGGLPLQAVVVGCAADVHGGDPVRASRRVTADALARGSDDLPGDVEHRAVLAQCRVWLEQYESAAAALDQLVEEARRCGLVGTLGPALTARSELAWWTGHWAAARADAEEALRWAEELQQSGMTAAAQIALARLDASRGDAAACRVRIDHAVQEAGPHRIDSTCVQVAAVLGLAALGVGDLAEAVEQLERAWRAAERGGLRGTTVVPFAGDLVEAHLRAGNRSRAGEALAWLEERAADGALVFPAAAAARCRGLQAENLESATAAFGTAGLLLRDHPVPFEQGRTLLCHGEALRRLRRPAAARPVLREALTVFGRLGARPWAARAETELAATGVQRVTADRAVPVLDELTPQELQIARVVAEGLNNAEAAARLYLSRKTVEAHLTRVYRKLGLRSRLDLARVLTMDRSQSAAQAPAIASPG